MPELSTLTTVITADVSGFSAGVSKVVSDAEKMRGAITQSVGGGFSGVKEELNSLRDRLFSFSGLLHIGFGGEAGRRLFHLVHEGVTEFAGGLIEGARAGEDFFSALETGSEKLLGMKTNLESAREEAEKYTATMKKVTEASNAIRQDLEGGDVPEFSYLKHGGKDAAELAKLKAAAEEAAKNAKPATDALLDIARRRENLPAAMQDLSNYSYGVYVGDTKEKLDAEEALVRSKNADYLNAADTSDSRYRARKTELEGANNNAGLTGFYNLIVSSAGRFADAWNKQIEDEAKKAAAEGQRIYQDVRSPLQKHADAMSQLDDLLESGSLPGGLDTYLRKKQQLDEEYERATMGLAPSLNKPSQHGSVEGVRDFANQLQQSVLGMDQPTGTEQKAQGKMLEQIDTDLQKAASIGFMFA